MADPPKAHPAGAVGPSTRGPGACRDSSVSHVLSGQPQPPGLQAQQAHHHETQVVLPHWLTADQTSRICRLTLTSQVGELTHRATWRHTAGLDTAPAQDTKVPTQRARLPQPRLRAGSRGDAALQDGKPAVPKTEPHPQGSKWALCPLVPLAHHPVRCPLISRTLWSAVTTHWVWPRGRRWDYGASRPGCYFSGRGRTPALLVCRAPQDSAVRLSRSGRHPPPPYVHSREEAPRSVCEPRLVRPSADQISVPRTLETLLSTRKAQRPP